MSFLYRETPRAFRPMENALSEDRQNHGIGRLPTAPEYHEGE
jgi:hypothetical protein